MKPSAVAAPPPDSVSSRILSVQLREQGTTSVVTIAGEIDISSVEAVRQVVDQALGSHPETLLLDLERIDFCDSTGIHMVVQTHHRATDQGVRFLVVPPAGNARRVFDICSIGDVVTFVAPS